MDDISDNKNIEMLDQHQVYQACKMLGNRIEKFSGTGDRTFEEFLEEHTDLVARFSIPRSVARSLLPLYLTGGAKLKYQTIPEHDSMTWEELVTELAKRMKSEALLSNLRDELHNLTQGKDSVGEFAKKVHNKTKIAFQGQGEGIVARMATDFFIKGLNPEIRRAIRRLPDTDDYDTVVCRAEKEHRILEQERREDRDTAQTINALIADDKINRLEQQLNQMKLSQRRPPTPIPTRAANSTMMNNRGRATNGFSFNRFSNNTRTPNNPFRSRGGIRKRFIPTWRNRPRVRFAPQPQYCSCPTHGCQPSTSTVNPSSVCQHSLAASRLPMTTANLLCLMTFLAIFSTTSAQYQLCGTNLHGNTFSLPEAIDCTVPSNAPMLRTTIQLYAEHSQPLLLNATKCYRDVLEIATSNFLYIRTTHTILNRRRISIPQGLCHSARITGKVHGHDLIRISSGLQSTEEIEEANMTLPLWGTNKYTRSIYSLETGQIASFDGKSIRSSLANLENCTLSDGFCLSKQQIVVWEPVHSVPLCRYTQVGSFEALVTMQYIVLPHADLVFKFSNDYLLHAHLTEQCKTLGNSYLTTSNHVITFPYTPQDIMIHDYTLRMAYRRRVKRATRYIKDKQGRTSSFQLVPSEPVPLIKRIFDTDVTNEIPNFRTRPIVKRRMLQDMSRWNVTNEDFIKRRRFYNITDPRLIALRTIRNFLQVQHLRTLSTVDPTWAARLLLGRNDVAASYVSGELQITKCRQVTPTHVYNNHTVNGTCYTLMPLLLEDELWFVVPGTKDLTQTSSTTSCPYQTIQPPRIPHKLLPPNTIVNTNIPPFLFDAPPIFYRTLQHSATSMTSQMEAMQQRQEEIILHLQKRGIVEDTVSKLRRTGSVVTQSLRSFYDSATRKLAHGINNIRWSLIHLILWISVPTIIIAIIITGCICYVKYKLFRHVSTSTIQGVARTFTSQKRNRQRSRSINVLLADLPPQLEREERLFIPRIYAIHTTNTGLPYLKVILGDNTTTALLDSGASISYMRNSTFQSLRNRPPITSQPLSASTANGSILQLQGFATLPVQIGTHTILHDFHIAADKDCPAPLLLGSDFIRNLNIAGLTVSIDLHNQMISIGSDTLNLVQLNHITLTPTNIYGVRVSGNVTLPRRTTSIIPVKIDNLIQPRCTTFLIEDNLRPMNHIYVVGRALVTPEPDGTSFINILNPSSTDIHLPNRMNVANAYPACASEIQVNTVQVTIPPVIEPFMTYPPKPTATICPISAQRPRCTAYIPPEADWENNLPHLPVPNPTFDIASEVDLSQAALTEEQKEQLRNIIRCHHNAFVGPDGHLGHYKGRIRHRIDLIDNAPIPTRKIYRVPLEKRQEIEKQITQMLNEGIIRESSSPFCAPIVLVRKREANTWRFTIDFRGLNAITKPQQSILPNIQDIIDLCANKCLYSSLDFQQGFHQIPLEESHCERTAFACFLGAFEYIRMPMGLKGAPATFQRIMDDFKKYLRARVFIYVDDLIITSETPDDHLIDIDEVLGKIELIGMKLKAAKCEFAKEEITFLGFVLSKDGIRPNPEKTKAIDNYPTPKNPTDVKSFLGMCSFFRRFINNFANIAAPLTALTKKDTPFLWAPECEEAAQKLKRALTSAPILAAPRLGKPFTIETDSSSKGVAGVLKQEQDDVVRVIAYASRKKNIVCDTLSRHLPTANTITTVQPTNLQLENIRVEQDQCPWITNIKQALERGDDSTRTYDYILLNNLLYKLPVHLHQDPQLILPQTSPTRNDIIALAHQSQLGTAHLGTAKTRAAVARIAIWNNMAKDVAHFVAHCQQCQRRKDPSAYRMRQPLGRFEISTRPWQRIHSDVIGPLPMTLDGNKFIIVFIDSFSKFIIAEPIADQKANTTAQIFMNRFVARFGLPEMLVTDQGSNYMSDIFRTLLRNLNVQHRTSTPYHHESNGQVERANRTIQEQIAIATTEHRDDWDNVLYLIVHAYNSVENSTTKYSPHFLVHGHEPNNVFHLALQLPVKKFADEDAYANHITNLLRTISENVKNNLRTSQDQQKHHYDLRKRTNKKTYNIGERIWIRKDGHNKITPRFEGPYTIIDIDLPNVTVRDGKKDRTVHINRTKPCPDEGNDDN
ncbi:integrase core domain protein [Ancylostoma duodenale]|uniref:RNA-directed DNA polymerase n=1 Tax=Ancylostoma duodenale TaxID=51022 RepID=A0A0C2GGV5_9BILA|nr:integrase core domain protein [Ancylostoma duodenale]